MLLMPHLKKLYILHRDEGKIVQFAPNESQIQYIAECERLLTERGRVRTIILKARQMGFSTATQAMKFTMAMMNDDYRGMTIAHKDKATRNLHMMSKIMWQRYFLKAMFEQTQDSRTELEWAHGSSMRTETAGAKDAGRSGTFHFLHCSEVAFWETAEDTMLSLLQAVPTSPGTFVALESTANGVGNWFHKEWLKAKAHETEYVPLFFPWYAYSNYRASAIGMPPAPLPLDSEERTLLAIGLDKDQLGWRRWAIRNLCGGDIRKFMQEYPANEVEAFLASGSNMFEMGYLKRLYKPMEAVDRGRLVRNGTHVQFVRDEFGPLHVFRRPSADMDWGRYFIGADPTHTTFGDFAVAQVINRRTLEQVAVWRDKTDPGTFARELLSLGLFYNQAIIAPEKEGPGQHVIGYLLGSGYPMVFQSAKIDKTPGRVVSDTWGWSTTRKTKHLAIQTLRHFVIDASDDSGVGLVIHDPITYGEMANYVATSEGGYANADGEPHDDHVMALAIAITCDHFMETKPPAYGLEIPGIPDVEELELDAMEFEPGWMSRKAKATDEQEELLV